MSYLLNECIEAFKPYCVIKDIDKCFKQDFSNAFIGERIWFKFKGEDYYIHEMYTFDNKHLFVIRNYLGGHETSNEDIHKCFKEFLNK